MRDRPLFDAVTALANRTAGLGDIDLDQPFAWRAHAEGARFALLGSYHELRALAVSLAARRATEGPPLTRMQRALGQAHAAYRDLQAVLLGVTDADWDAKPAPGEWPLRSVVGHVAGAERAFYSLLHHGLARQRAGLPPEPLPEDAPDRLVGAYADFRQLMLEGSREDFLAWYDDRHEALLQDFAAVTDAEAEAVTLWWEEEPLSLEYRVHRVDAHLRQHTVQVAKTRRAIGCPPSEAQALLRLVYQALAEAETATIGAPGLGAAECAALAGTLRARADAVAAAVERAHAVVSAATRGDLATLSGLLAEDGALAAARAPEGVLAVMAALYHGQPAAAAALADAGADLWIWEGAALGRQAVVEAAVAEWPAAVNLVAKDGFTPLQLACFFGHAELARWLVAQGAEVNAVSENAMALTPIHAAAARGDVATVTVLLDHGADVNARQAGGYTALHAAAADGNLALAERLLAGGADAAAATDDGRTALDLAEAGGHGALAARLRAGGAKA